MHRYVTVVLCLAAVCGLRSLVPFARAETPTASMQFDQAYSLLVGADEARDGLRFAAAIELYHRARQAYRVLSQQYPDWQPGVVRFRVAYCDNQIEALMRRVDPALVKLGAAPPPGDPPVRTATLPPPSPSGVPLAEIRKQAARLLDENDAEKARAALLSALEIDPDDIGTRLLMAAAQCQAAEFEDAIFLLEHVIEDAPASAEAHVLLGTAHFGLGRMPPAMASMKRALEIDPGLDEAHYDLAQILRMLIPPDLDGARDHYQKSLDLGGAHDAELDALFEGEPEAEPIAPIATVSPTPLPVAEEMPPTAMEEPQLVPPEVSADEGPVALFPGETLSPDAPAIEPTVDMPVPFLPELPALEPGGGSGNGAPQNLPDIAAVTEPARLPPPVPEPPVEPGPPAADSPPLVEAPAAPDWVDLSTGAQASVPPAWAELPAQPHPEALEPDPVDD